MAWEYQPQLDSMFANAFSPIRRLGEGQLQIAIAQQQRQQAQADAERMFVRQQQLAQQEHTQRVEMAKAARMFQEQENTKAREAQILDRLQGEVFQQNQAVDARKAIAERQAADDERAGLLFAQKRAADAGINVKGKTASEISREVDLKFAERAGVSMQERASAAAELADTFGTVSRAAKLKAAQLALQDPAVLSYFSVPQIQELQKGTLTVEKAIDAISKDYIFRSGAAESKAKSALAAYQQALKQATEDQKDSPDYQASVKAAALQKTIARLDAEIDNWSGKILSADVARSLYAAPVTAKMSAGGDGSSDPIVEFFKQRALNGVPQNNPFQLLSVPSIDSATGTRPVNQPLTPIMFSPIGGLNLPPSSVRGTRQPFSFPLLSAPR